MPLSTEANGLNAMTVFVGRSLSTQDVDIHQFRSHITTSADFDFDLFGASDSGSWPTEKDESDLQNASAGPLKFKPLLVGYLTFLALSRDNLNLDPSHVQVRIADEGDDRVEIVLPSSGVDELREGARVARSVFEGLTAAHLRSTVRIIFSELS